MMCLDGIWSQVQNLLLLTKGTFFVFLNGTQSNYSMFLYRCWGWFRSCKPATFCSSDTVPETRVFSVLLGTFLHDVELRNITFSTGVLTVEESNAKGFTVQEHSLANGSKSFSLQVPFDADVVLKHVSHYRSKISFLTSIFSVLLSFYFICCRIPSAWLHPTSSLWSLGWSSCLKKLLLVSRSTCRPLCRMLVRSYWICFWQYLHANCVF